MLGVVKSIVLGSTSPYRKALLERLGVSFEVAKPLADEENAKALLKKQGVTPLQLAQGLARIKAESLRQKDAVIIGGDQLVHLNGQILGKPHTEEKAISQLSQMSGQTHEIITAVCLTLSERNIEFFNIARMKMKKLNLSEIKAYVQRDQPLDCAGSYKIEKNGRSLFEQIQCDDFTSIEGLPLIQLAEVLQTLGYETKKIHPTI